MVVRNMCNSEFLKQNIIKRYSHYTDKGAVFAERFNRTTRNLVKKPVFEKSKASWIDELPCVIKQYNNTVHSSIKMTAIQTSKKSNEIEVYSNPQDKRKILNPKNKLGQLVRTADIKRVFSKGDSTNWSYKLFTITDFIHDTTPSYRIKYLTERYNENLLLPTKLNFERTIKL